MATKIVEAACSAGRESAKRATVKIGADGTLVSYLKLAIRTN